MSKYAKKVETDIGVTAYEVYKPKMSKNNWKQNGFHREYDLKGVRLIKFPQNTRFSCAKKSVRIEKSSSTKLWLVKYYIVYLLLV